ncbi:hypothetical protein H4R20_006636 [Coemansia guatemalensis]|uniref:Uncharacterized protein n=1 Tax=Coemansia guatemalensis TaxID=2761395 RepID=A0A9W8HMG0_9FUNG|nr:hypothetical protein H4R20_006636 [Coemansia guatemalensis]
MGYIYPKRAPSTSESPKRPVKRLRSTKRRRPVKCRRKDKRKKLERVASSTEAVTKTAVMPQLPPVPALPCGFPLPPSGYELLFKAWGDKWRETHGAANACGDLQIRLLEFIEATKMAQDMVVMTQHTTVEIQRRAIDKISQAIDKLQDKLYEVKIDIAAGNKDADPSCVGRLNDLISELNKRLYAKRLDEILCTIQELLEG